MSELVFYTNPNSRGRIVRWMLEEVGEPYRTEIVAYDAIKSPDYLAINPMGKVPALTHGDVVVTEAAAICAYLADAFPEKGLAPPLGDPRRGPYFRWLFFAAGCVEPAVVGKSLGFVVPPERKMMAGYGSLEDTLDALETAVTGKPFILGDRFSAADVYVGSQIGWGLQFGSIDPRPAFVAYSEALRARPAAQRAWQIDDELAAAAQAPAPQPEPA